MKLLQACVISVTACLCLPAIAAPTAPAPGGPSAPADTPEDQVIGGAPAPDGKWPDAAAVFVGSEAVCTGVLIAPNVVITAGHCTTAPQPTSVELATTRLDQPGEAIGVAQVISYPNWYDTFDVGLLVLERDSAVAPRTLAIDCIGDDYVKNGAPVTIVGWGATSIQPEQYPIDLMEADTTITDVDCSSPDVGCAAKARPAGELGAGGDGIDSCFGDSGGPLYLRTERGDFLVGITSRGYENTTTECSEGGIYVRPDALLDWIQREAGVELARPCNVAPEPTAAALEVDAGDTAVADIQANDPDQADGHTFSLVLAPEHGRVELSSGEVLYTADDDYEGPDAFVVEVTDSGEPNLSGEVQVDVTVFPAAGCGCRTSSRGGTAGGLALALLVVLGLARPGRRPRIRRVS